MRYRPGDPFEPTAEQLNGWETARQNSRPRKVINNFNVSTETIPVLIKNESGADVPFHSAMAIGDPIIMPDLNEDGTDKTYQFYESVAFKCSKPDEETVANGRWCVTVEPILNNGYGWAMLMGVLPCRINVLGVSDTHVTIVEDDHELKTGPSGLGKILWVAGGVGTASEEGLQPAVILVGGGGASENKRFVRVKAVSVVSSNKWSYTIDEVDGDTGYNWKLKTGGIADAIAYSLAEVPNSATGMQGDGVIVEQMLEGQELLPIGIGKICELFVVPHCDGEIRYWIDGMNQIKPGCGI